MHNSKSTNIKAKLFYVVAFAIALISLLYPFFNMPIPVDKNEAARLVMDARPMPVFSKIENVVEKKKAFFSYLLPEINRQNEIVQNDRELILTVKDGLDSGQQPSIADMKKINMFAKQYRVDSTDTLENMLEQLARKVDVIPAELVLMQAANESAWGTSRFARKGYNFFGLWCFSKGCGFVPQQRNTDAIHEVHKFNNLTLAVRTYLTNLNRHSAYKELRDIRYQLRQSDSEITAEKLVHGLESYSERGQEYIEELLQMMRFNRKFMEV